MSRVIAAILLTLAPAFVLIWNTEARTRGVDFKERSGDWTRAWDDVAIGAGVAAFGAFPVAPYLVTNGFSRRGQVAFDAFKSTFSRLEDAQRARLSRPWEGFAAPDLFAQRPRVARRFDDLGRAYLLGLGFRLRGRVMPGLLFWLAPSLAAMVFLWIVIEALRSGLPFFGLAASLLVAVSSFSVDVLTLGYSAAGFYLVSILVCLAYGIGVLGRPPSISGLIARSLMAGAFLGVTIAARSVSLAVLPSLLVVAALGVRRCGEPLRRLAAAGVAAVACLIGPALFLHGHLDHSARLAADRFGGDVPPASHDIWITYWQGLGDFDRTHGNTFVDQAGLAVLRDHGGRERVSEKSEVIMRRLVIESIASEPGWFAGILFRRALLTLSFWKLWPSASDGSPGFYPSRFPNEGQTDSYWAMTDQADTFRFGSSTVEVPAICFPLLLLAFFLAGGRRVRSHRDESAVTMLKVVSLLALAALPGPVATTTAGAFEPQSFVVVVFAATAGLVQLTAWVLSDRPGAAA